MSLTDSSYHFSVSFLEYFLRNGLESPHRLLNEYIKEHTTCVPGDTGDPFTLHEPELHIQVQMLGFEWDRLQSGRLVFLLPIPSFDIRQIRPHFKMQRATPPCPGFDRLGVSLGTKRVSKIGPNYHF
jgi:hypothetical protein